MFPGLASATARAEAETLYKQGRHAEKRGDSMHAYLLYAEAAALEPANREFLKKKDALSALLAARAETLAAPDPGAQADLDQLKEDGPALETLSPGEISTEAELAPPPHLAAPPGAKQFDLRGTGQKVLDQVANAFGIKLLFEAGYQDSPPFVFRAQMTMEEAFRALETATNSMIVPLSDHMALVVRDSPQRRSDSAPVMFSTIPIPERISVQEAQEIVTAVQQVLQMKSIAVDPGRHLIYLRDAVSKVIAARQIVADLSRARAQVEIEVELLTVSKTSALGMGLTLPNSTTLVNFGHFLGNTFSPGNFTQFATFGGGASLFGLGVTAAQAFATVANTSSASIFSSDLVSLDGQAATLSVGQRYPIITNQYVGQTAGTTGTVYTPPPTVNFEDLGLVLKITPTVHDGGEMTLDIDAAYKVLGALNANGIPTIAQNKYTGKVRLGPDEWAVVAGLTEQDETATKSGFPWLSRIPWIGRLFRNDTVNKNSTETLLVLKPRLINLPPWDYPTHELWVGTENKPISVY